ncbi:MAG: Gfo/Idh/MocA family oxidoreductase [Verrucomicrobia bacterium]|nr:Gfo/Idh/MocA family oxidoreductase [Verrucomicrobiota bacterium]
MQTNLAILGGGYGANVLLPAFAASPQFRVAALWTRSPAKVEAAAKAHHVERILTDWRELLDDKSIEAVAITLPPRAQAEIAAPLAAAGKHLFLEKPLAASLADAEAIAQAAAQSGAKVVVDFGFRFVSAFQQMHELLRERRLGAVKSVAVDWQIATSADPSLPWNWKSDAKQGGGTLNLMGSHVLDYLCWWFGDARLDSSKLSSTVKSRPDADTGQPRPVEADDTCELALSFDSFAAEVIVSTAASANGPHRIKIQCERGLIELCNPQGKDYFSGFEIKATDFEGSRLRERFADASRSPKGFDESADHRIAIARWLATNFASAIHGAQPPYPSLEDGLCVQRLLEAAHRAGH